MHQIPAIHSLLSPVHLAGFLERYYAFNTTPACRLLKSGMNQTYLVEDADGKYILRVYTLHWRPDAEIQAEIDLLLQLHRKGISVSVPVPDAQGVYIREFAAPEGIRNVTLFSFAKGEKVRNLSPETCQSIGQMIGRMHQVTHDQKISRITYSPETLLTLPYAHACGYFSESLEEMVYIKKAGSYLSDLFSQSRFVDCSTGIVHLDLWYDNMSIEQGGGITFFDFDFCGNGWLVLDVAYFLMQLFNTEPDKAAYEFKRASFLEGYEETRHLSEAEKELIPYLGLAIWIFYLGVQSQTFDTYSNVFFSENYLRHFMGIAKNWLRYHHIEL